MLKASLSVLLFLSLCGAAAALRCRWMEHKFSQYSRNSLTLLEAMVNNSTNSTEAADEEGVVFPSELHSQASKAPAEDRVAFVAQILDEVATLFEENHNSTSWQEDTVENFVNVLTQQVDGLRACIGSHNKKNKKLHLYFKRLSSHILERNGHSAASWELVRKEVKMLLFRAEQLTASLIRTN